MGKSKCINIYIWLCDSHVKIWKENKGLDARVFLFVFVFIFFLIGQLILSSYVRLCFLVGASLLVIGSPLSGFHPVFNFSTSLNLHRLGTQAFWSCNILPSFYFCHLIFSCWKYSVIIGVKCFQKSFKYFWIESKLGAEIFLIGTDHRRHSRVL